MVTFGVYVPNDGHKPTMLVTDLSLIKDPAYEKISRRFYENPEEFNAAVRQPGIN